MDTWQERKAKRERQTALEHAEFLNSKYAPTQEEWSAHWARTFKALSEGKFKFTLGDCE